MITPATSIQKNVKKDFYVYLHRRLTDGVMAEWLKSIGFENATKTAISHCCIGKAKSCYGFSWRKECQE